LPSKTPFSLSKAFKGFIKLKALGLQPSEAAMLSYGNTASAMGENLNQMVEAVADAATGEFERLRNSE
jgi:phosphotransacetylase